MNPCIPVRLLHKTDSINEVLTLANAEGFDVLAANSLRLSRNLGNVRQVSDDVFQQMITVTQTYKSKLLFVKVERGMDADEALRIMQDGSAEELEKPMQIVTIQQPDP